MVGPRTYRSVWIWLVIAAVFFVRLEGAHLHLCFDGSEPPAAVHVADSADHDAAHHPDEEHVDQDVELSDAMLLKKLSSGLDVPIAVAAAVLFIAPVVVETSDRPAPITYPTPLRLFAFDPPPRGPPR